MSEDDQDLAEIIARFVESLPSTISADVLVFVLMYAFDEDPRELAKFVPNIRDKLTKVGGMKRMSATLRTVASLDHILSRSATNIRRAKIEMQNAPLLRREIVERFLAGHPLRQKHYDKALADWSKLRATRISHQSLLDYEDNLLSPRRRGK